MTGSRPTADRIASTNPWNWVIRTVVHGTGEAATLSSAATFTR